MTKTLIARMIVLESFVDETAIGGFDIKSVKRRREKHLPLEAICVDKYSKAVHIGNCAKRASSRATVFERASPLEYMDRISLAEKIDFCDVTEGKIALKCSYLTWKS